MATKDRFEVLWREEDCQRIPFSRKFPTFKSAQDFVNKHRAIGYALAKRNAKKLKRLRRRSAWVWYQQRVIAD